MRSELVVVGLGLPGEEERGGGVGYVVESGIVEVRIALVALDLGTRGTSRTRLLVMVVPHTSIACQHAGS